MSNKQVVISVCGLAKGEPGPAAVGACIYDDAGKVLQKSSVEIGNATAEYAAFFAVVHGLQSAVDLFGDKTRKMQFALRLSNKTVIEQLNIKAEIHNVALVGHYIEIHNLRAAHFPQLTFVQVKQATTKEVEQLVKKTLDVK